jgi:hypothetical protein
MMRKARNVTFYKNAYLAASNLYPPLPEGVHRDHLSATLTAFGVLA